MAVPFRYGSKCEPPPVTNTVMSSKRSSLCGFTLIEILVVLAITTLLASVALPLSELTRQRQKEEQLRVHLREIRDAIDAYKRAVDEGRIQRIADETGYPKTLDDLVNGVPDMRSPRRTLVYFLRRIPRDPFADTQAEADQTWRLRSYESGPDNPRSGRDVYDVLSTSDRIGLNGVPYAQW